MSLNSCIDESLVKILLVFVSAIFPVSGSIRGEESPPPGAFIVYEHSPFPGKRITPYLQYQVETAWRQDESRKARLASISNETDFLQFQRELRQKLLDMIGGLPGQKTPLNPRITGTIQQEGYRIEKLIFESLPGFHVTALVYVPDGPATPKPAVLVACGHSAIAKAYPGYQRICARLARRGYVVLCWDPVGQGERSQFWDKEHGRSRYNLICNEHAVLGNLSNLAGANLIRWMIWDGMRALDYLLTRPDVDSTRISITGTSGGGTQSSHIGALDRRIGVVAPSCYICALPMRMNNRIYDDPDTDPEQDIYRMVSAGVDHPGLLLLTYPRSLIVCAAVEDMFPIEGTRKTFRESASIYRMFNIPERISITEGYHGHLYSDYNQEAAFDFMDRFNNMPVRSGLDSTKVFTEEELRCTRSGQVLVDFNEGKTLMEIIKQYYLKRKNTISIALDELYYGDYYPGIHKWPVVSYKGKRPLTEIAWEATGSTDVDGLVIDRYVLRHSHYLTIPLIHIHRQGEPVQRALLWFSSKGKASSSDWPEIKKYLEDGYQVISFDFRALGENQMRYQASYRKIDYSSLTREDIDRHYKNPILGVLANYVYNSLLTGRPYFLQMIEDAEIVARFVSDKLGAKSIRITADRDAGTLAYRIAEVIPEIRLLSQQEEIIQWSEIVEEKREIWPIEYLLPGGAYIR